MAQISPRQRELRCPSGQPLLHAKRSRLRWYLPREEFRACPAGRKPRGRPWTHWKGCRSRLPKSTRRYCCHLFLISLNCPYEIYWINLKSHYLFCPSDLLSVNTSVCRHSANTMSRLILCLWINVRQCLQTVVLHLSGRSCCLYFVMYGCHRDRIK